MWYSVWDIWRRVLFVGANLFISVTTRSVVLVRVKFTSNFVEPLFFVLSPSSPSPSVALTTPTPSYLQLTHCLLILCCLCVLCFVKPYKKYHINVMEMLVLLSLFGATVCILDNNDLYIGPIISAGFIAFPFVYGVVFIAFRLTRKMAIAGW